MQCLPALLTHHFLVPPIAFLILPNIHDPCLHIPNIFALPVPTLLQVRRDRALAETLADDGKRFDAVDVVFQGGVLGGEGVRGRGGVKGWPGSEVGGNPGGFSGRPQVS